MKLALFNDYQLGVVSEGRVYDVGAWVNWRAEKPQESLVRLMASYDQVSSRLQGFAEAPSQPLAQVRLRPPVPAPSKIVAAPVNYYRHQDEMNRQFNNAEHTIEKLGFFLKAPSSIIGPGDAVQLPHADRRFDHEAELAFVVGRRARHVSAADAHKYIFAYFALMDITMRGMEDRPMRKSFDTFTPIGPWLVTADEVENPHQLDLRLWVNDDLRQDANTSDLIYDSYQFFALASSVMTLEPGDILTTGTPEGVGPIQPGDTVRIQIERIGEFSVAVEAERSQER
ncbi:fumarylacetoacetate hydrolase family protein [Alicyclobacillus shizuokensis]|uniref:fumarylacetoacetate hydrolase family protein n=1 Tax=Alicyclobacillus shizuokensis TaxID=392014 RepID=UPI0008367ACF|nr:fumarylacetoacetate hydrolase family protein [Alicyclobacillus shizuokensis]